MIGQIDVSDPAGYAKEYLPKAREIIKAHGGRLVAAAGAAATGSQVIAIDGEAPSAWSSTFYPSMEALQAWRNDPAYVEVRRIGEEYAKYHTFAEAKAMRFCSSNHSVRSIAELADRVIAMYLGKIIAEGNADDVMSDETVRRVYLGGDIGVLRPPRLVKSETRPLLQIEQVGVSYGKATALEKVNLSVNQRERVSIVGLNGAGKTSLFNAISGLLPYSGVVRFEGRELASSSAGEIAKYRDHDSPRKSRPRRTPVAAKCSQRSNGQHIRAVSDPGLEARSGRANPFGRRAADACDRPGPNDASEAADP